MSAYILLISVLSQSKHSIASIEIPAALSFAHWLITGWRRVITKATSATFSVFYLLAYLTLWLWPAKLKQGERALLDVWGSDWPWSPCAATICWYTVTNSQWSVTAESDNTLFVTSFDSRCFDATSPFHSSMGTKPTWIPIVYFVVHVCECSSTNTELTMHSSICLKIVPIHIYNFSVSILKMQYLTYGPGLRL